MENEMTEDALRPVVSVPDSIRVDLQLIASLIRPGSRVLDVGCGDGSKSCNVRMGRIKREKRFQNLFPSS